MRFLHIALAVACAPSLVSAFIQPLSLVVGRPRSKIQTLRASLELSGSSVTTVKADGSEVGRFYEGKEFMVEKGTIDLPTGRDATSSPDLVENNTGLPGIERKGTALVYRPADTEPVAGIVFGHGFSQKPINYVSLLRSFAAAGYIVIAPNIWLLDVIWPNVKVETVEGCFAPAAKLQSALIIDLLRSIKVLQDEGIQNIAISGHSMGGAVSLVVPSLLDENTTLLSSGLLSPYPDLVKTTLNPYLFTTNGIVDADGSASLFKSYDTYPESLLVTAKNDRISKPALVESAFEAMAKSPEMKDKSTLAYMTNGAHIGFQDSLRVSFKIFGKTISLFDTLSFLLYGLDILDSIWNGVSLDTQLAQTKRFLLKKFAKDLGGTDNSAEVSLPRGEEEDPEIIYTKGSEI